MEAGKAAQPCTCSCLPDGVSLDMAIFCPELRESSGEHARETKMRGDELFGREGFEGEWQRGLRIASFCLEPHKSPGQLCAAEVHLVAFYAHSVHSTDAWCAWERHGLSLTLPLTCPLLADEEEESDEEGSEEGSEEEGSEEEEEEQSSEEESEEEEEEEAPARRGRRGAAAKKPAAAKAAPRKRGRGGKAAATPEESSESEEEDSEDEGAARKRRRGASGAPRAVPKLPEVAKATRVSGMGGGACCAPQCVGGRWWVCCL